MSSPIATVPATSPREPLSRGRIVGAAITVLDRDGLAGLTMRRVARELEAGAMSLYRHVASREELLDLVLDELAAAVPVSLLTGAWRTDVAALARDTRAALLRRRDMTLLLTARLGQGGAALPLLDRALGIFLRAGFPPRDAVRANHALGGYVSGSCTWEAVGLAGAVDPAERAERAASAAASLGALPADTYPHLAAVAGELFSGTADDRFEYGLARLLDGLAVRLANASGGSGGTPLGGSAEVPEVPAAGSGPAGRGGGS